MPTLNQKGVAHLLLPIILILGLIAAVYLITSGNPLKLFSKASNAAVVFKDINGQALPQKNSIPYTTSPTIKIEFTSLLGPPVSVSGPISGSGSKSAPRQSAAGGASCTPCNADIDRNGNVDIKDFSRLSACFGKKATDTDVKGNSCAAADINGDGMINITDFSCLRSQFGKKCEQAVPAGTGTVAYRFAENPADLETATYMSYTQEPMVVTYTFSTNTSGIGDTTPGRKFIFVQFKDNTGRTADRSAQVELVAPASSPSPANSFRNFIFQEFGFTSEAQNFIVGNSTIAVKNLKASCGGGGWYSTLKLVSLECAQYEAGLHELSHVWWQTYRLQHPDAVKGLARDVVRLADGDGSSVAVTFAKGYVYGNGNWKGMYCTNLGCADVHNIKDSDFDITLALWHAKIIDWEIYAGLSSWTMGKFKDGPHALPNYLWQYFSPEFTGVISAVPYYQGGHP